MDKIGATIHRTSDDAVPSTPNAHEQLQTTDHLLPEEDNGNKMEMELEQKLKLGVSVHTTNDNGASVFSKSGYPDEAKDVDDPVPGDYEEDLLKELHPKPDFDEEGDSKPAGGTIKAEVDVMSPVDDDAAENTDSCWAMDSEDEDEVDGFPDGAVNVNSAVQAMQPKVIEDTFYKALGEFAIGEDRQ